MNEPALVSHVNQREISIVQKFYNTVTRKKPVGYTGVFREDTYNANQRWMGTGRTLLDITTTGLSNTIGSPLYILTGFVIKTKAGPAIVISYLIASISSLCAALTYSELMNQISTHGSDYLYSYVTMGELYGFLVGWNLILEYCVDVASVSKALTIHIDKIYFEGEISTWQTKTAPFPGSSYFDANHVDLFSVAFCFILTLIIAMGGKFSKVVNNFFTCFNLVCYVSIMVFGSFSCNLSYWTMEKEGRNMSIPTVSPPPIPAPTLPPVGFMPWDFRGALQGAGSCIFAFAGFRAIFGDGVKSKNPKRNLPIASISTLIISTVLYIGVSFTISCMIPSWKIDTAAPIFSAFTEHNLLPLQKLLAIGAIAGLVQASIYKFLPLPPLLTMMSEDGLLFKFMGDVDKETGGPFKGTVTYGIVSTVFVAVLVIDELIDMLSIGTLIAYIMASVSIIRLRYKPINGDYLNGNSSISLFTERKVKVSLVIYTITVTVFGYLIANLDPTSIPFITSASVLAFIMLICGTLIYLQPQNVQQLSFYCPCVPLMPLFSIFLNSVLMMHLSYKTWIRFAVWMGIGLVVYFVYSIRYSNLSDTSTETLGKHSGGYPNSDPPKRTHVRRVSRQGRLDGYHIDHTPLPSNRRSRSTPAKSARAGVRNQSREEQMAARLREWNEFLRAQNLNRQRAELSGDPEGSVGSQPRISYKTNSNGGV